MKLLLSLICAATLLCFSGCEVKDQKETQELLQKLSEHSENVDIEVNIGHL